MTRHDGGLRLAQTGVGMLVFLGMSLAAPATQADPRASRQTISTGPVSLPVTVFMTGRAVRGTFQGTAKRQARERGYLTIRRPRIVVRGKQYYVGQRALARLFPSFDAESSGQTLVWGQSLTRNPRSWLPAVRPALIDVVDGRLAPVKKNHAKGRWVYYNGPWGWLGKRATGQDRIALGD